MLLPEEEFAYGKKIKSSTPLKKVISILKRK